MEISNLIFSPNKTYLLASDNRGYIYIWRCKQLIISVLLSDYEEPKFFSYICKIKLDSEKINSLILSNDENPILICACKNDVRGFAWKKLNEIIDNFVEKNENMKELDLSDQFVFSQKIDLIDKNDVFSNFVSLAYNEESKEIAAGSQKGKILIVDLISQKNKFNFCAETLDNKNQYHSISDVIYRNVHQIISGTSSGILQMWDGRSGAKIQTFSEKKVFNFSKINKIQLEKNSENWIVCAHDDYISKWNINMNALNYVLETEIGTNTLSLTNDFIYSGHNDESICKWSSDGKYISSTQSNSKAISSILIDHDENTSQTIMITAGCGNFIDTFYNNSRIFSFVAE